MPRRRTVAQRKRCAGCQDGDMTSPHPRISARVSAIAESATLAVDTKAKALQGGRAARDRVRRGRAGLPHSRLHRRGGASAACARAALPQVHPRRRAAGTARGGRGQDRPRLRLTRSQREPGADHQRRQAGGLRGVRDPARPRRRGAAADPVLDHLPGGDRAGGRRAGPGHDRRAVRLPARQRPTWRRPAPAAPRCWSSSRRPTRPGRSTRPSRWRRSGSWAAERGLWVVTDEIYEHLVYGEARFASIPVAAPEIADRCVVLNGVAKTYAMTGWRVGWMIGPPDVVKAAANLQSHATSNVCNVAQAAALTAVTGDLSAVAEMRAAFDRRRLAMTTMLNDIPGVICPLPEGAFYCYPSVKGVLGKELAGSRPAQQRRAGRAHPGPRRRRAWSPARPSAPPGTSGCPAPSATPISRRGSPGSASCSRRRDSPAGPAHGTAARHTAQGAPAPAFHRRDAPPHAGRAGP